jgi:hypothetical protein
LVVSAALLMLGVGDVAAQSPQGATMTVLQGEVAVVRVGGSSIQPAPSGLTVNVGDQVATLGGAGALVTFFEGTELEMASGATVIIREIRSSGTEVHVTIENVVGGTLGRVTAFVNPNSSYTLTTPGGQVVALIRGSETYINLGPNQSGTAGISCPTIPCSLSINGQSVQNGTGATNWAFTPDEFWQIRNSGGNPLGQGDDGGNPDDGQQPGGGTTGTENQDQVNQSLDEENEEEEEEEEEDEEEPPPPPPPPPGGTGSYRGTTPLTAEVLRTRLEGGLTSFTTAGALLALGMISWSCYGSRRRDE